MLSDDYLPVEISDKVIKKLLQSEENTFCVECFGSSVEYGSVAHGTFLCVLCAKSQERLKTGPIKPLDVQWKASELRLMVSGGNSAFKDFFSFYKLTEAPVDYKYKTRAAYFYRQVLAALAENKACDLEYPRLDEGLETFDDELSCEISINSTDESFEFSSKWKWLSQIYKQCPEIRRKSFEAVDKSVKRIKEITSVENIISGAKKSISEISVSRVKVEAWRIIEDVENYFSKSGNYLNFMSACSRSEISWDSELDR